mgnify:CR=1 FL=1
MGVYDAIDSGKMVLTKKVARVLFMTLEHEAMHAETLLYMLIQRAGSGTIPPPGFTAPPWQSLAAEWDTAAQPESETVVLGPGLVTLGHDDAEDDDGVLLDVGGSAHEFGWDNEHPKRVVEVPEFRISWRPVTNGQFYQFWKTKGEDVKVDLPASWIEEDGVLKVRTFGVVGSLTNTFLRFAPCTGQCLWI